MKMTTKTSYHLRQMEFHRRELEKLMSWGEDDYADGAILYFEKSFTERQGARKYKYTALKSQGVWYPSGPKRKGEPLSWEDLVDFMSTGVDQVYWVIDMAPIKPGTKDPDEDYEREYE